MIYVFLLLVLCTLIALHYGKKQVRLIKQQAAKERASNRWFEAHQRLRCYTDCFTKTPVRQNLTFLLRKKEEREAWTRYSAMILNI